MDTQSHDAENRAEVPDAERLPASARWRTELSLYLVIAAGGIAGSVLRWWASLAFRAVLALPLLPWGTLFVNVTGSFVIGFFSAFSGPEGRLFAGSRTRHFIMTGVCGGYTTFSSFSLETVRLFQTGHLLAALLNIAVSIAAWLVAVWAGDALASRLNRFKGA